MKSFLAFVILLLIFLCFACERNAPITPTPDDVIDGFEFYE